MNSAYKEYRRLAYTRAIVQQLQRFVMEYLNTDSVPLRTLICEEVMVADREIPEDYFHDYLDVLRKEEDKLSRELAHYEFRKKESSVGEQEEQKATSDSGKKDEEASEGKGG